MTIKLGIIFTILLFILAEWGWYILEKFRERKYHREYMRDWRADKKVKELHKLREWRKNIILVKDMKGKVYGISR